MVDSYVIYPHRSDSLTGSGYLIEPTLSPTRGTYGMVEMVQTPSTSEKDSTEPKLPVAETVPNMSEKDVKVLRVKTNASTAWSEDEERGNKIDGMSNDEAAAIMLYTQGKRKGSHSV